MEEWSILEIQDQMANGQCSARALTRLYLDRIDQIDKHGPNLRAVIEINPDALEIASQLDAERAAGKTRGPLHGIPILLKDNIDTADAMPTTAGSLALRGSIACQDAHVAARLRAAGAVLLGKTNLSEWANFRSTHSISGWSSHGGQTRNPYALDRSPCGSSSGSAVAVAANLCSAAIGTETDGSIICPAQTNGIVGIKPTLGLVSRAGIIPIAHSQDTAGPMARSVTDAAIVLGVLAGTDPLDADTQLADERGFRDYIPFLDKDGLRGARIGVARNFSGYAPAVEAIFEDCLRILQTQGAELVDPANIVTEKDLAETEMEVLYYEFQADLNAYLAALPTSAAVHSMQDLVDFNQAYAAHVMPFFGQERMQTALTKGPLSEARYQQALATNHRLARAEGIDAALREHSVQALVAMSGSPAWLVDIVNGDHAGGGSCSSPAAVAGYPHITVPAGFVRGLPVGLSFFGTAWSEPQLLRFAYAFEQATHTRRPPTFLPSIRI